MKGFPNCEISTKISPIYNLETTHQSKLNRYYLEFSDGSDIIVTLRARTAFIDTVIYRCRNGDQTRCLRERSIVVMTCSDEAVSTIGSHDNRTIALDTCVACCDDSGVVNDAIIRINTYFNGKRYILNSGTKGFRIWWNQEDCLHDRATAQFPIDDE